ncbi:MAG: hypothetical protein EPO21_02485 [Chloroflexota bacterium]|nr:MAG: hypothetical protein EPO21_02485 [Chloroflexota bacterium]
MAKKRYGFITDDMVAQARARIGTEWIPEEPYYNTVASRDAIRHFVDGIGDLNPLFRDPSYAAETRNGRVMAPPTFLYSVYWPAGRAGVLPAVPGFHSGNEWRWFLPIVEGDALTFSVRATDVVERESKKLGRICTTYDEITYRNQAGAVVATAQGWSMAIVGVEPPADEGSLFVDPEEGYTPEELERIYGDYDREAIRGNVTRFWEDVAVGEELTPVVKGPLAQRDIAAWYAGAGFFYMPAHRPNPRTVEKAMPRIYDFGSQRDSWLGHLLTNWAGDDGFICHMRAENHSFNRIGDTTWCRGKVERKFVSDGECLVEIDCWAENQRGTQTIHGKATIALPSREHGTFPLERRLARA